MRTPDSWEFVKREDGSFDIIRQGSVVKSGIPERWLEEQLAQYGFCGQEYRAIRRQLDEAGKARIGA